MVREVELNGHVIIEVVEVDLVGNVGRDEVASISSSTSEHRYAYFFEQVFSTGHLILARDDDWLSLNYGGGEALPVWCHRRFAQAALPRSTWPKFEFVEYDIIEFAEKFTSLPHDDLYVIVMPNETGEGEIVEYSYFVETILEGKNWATIKSDT